MKVLCLMYAFSLQSKKRRKLSETLFYYCLVNFDLLKLFEASNEELRNGLAPSPNLYFRFQKKINGILINMLKVQFIDVKGDISNKLEDITVQITPIGKEFYQKQNSEFFLKLQEKYENAFEKVGFSTNNIKVLKGVQQ